MYTTSTSGSTESRSAVSTHGTWCSSRCAFRSSLIATMGGATNVIWMSLNLLNRYVRERTVRPFARSPTIATLIHRTQALLDLYTIKDELNRVDGIKVAMVGDLANGRTVRSLTYLLSKFKDIQMTFVAPSMVAMRDDLKAHLDEHHVPWVETADLDSVLPEVDVVYMTRIQKERFSDRAAYEAVKGVYRIDKRSLELMRKYAVVMHPLPRVDEIAPDVDADTRAAYFRQARNGLHVRMPLLDRLLA